MGHETPVPDSPSALDNHRPRPAENALTCLAHLLGRQAACEAEEHAVAETKDDMVTEDNGQRRKDTYK